MITTSRLVILAPDDIKVEKALHVITKARLERHPWRPSMVDRSHWFTVLSLPTYGHRFLSLEEGNTKGPRESRLSLYQYRS